MKLIQLFFQMDIFDSRRGRYYHLSKQPPRPLSLDAFKRYEEVVRFEKMVKMRGWFSIPGFLWRWCFKSKEIIKTAEGRVHFCRTRYCAHYLKAKSSLPR